MPYAGVAHPVERHLAKVEVASSSLVARSKFHAHADVWAWNAEILVDFFEKFAYNRNSDGDIAKW